MYVSFHLSLLSRLLSKNDISISKFRFVYMSPESSIFIYRPNIMNNFRIPQEFGSNKPRLFKHPLFLCVLCLFPKSKLAENPILEAKCCLKSDLKTVNFKMRIIK